MLQIPFVRRFQEVGLIAVILGLSLVLVWAGEPVTIQGRQVNNFLRLDNLLGNVATPMSWIAIMAIGATFVIAGGGIDISVGSVFGLTALGTAAVLQQLPPDASPWLAITLGAAVPMAIGVLCGLINGGLIVGLRMHPFIVTLGTLSIFRGIALVSVPEKSLPSADLVLPYAFTTHFVGYQCIWPRAGAPPIILQPVPMLFMLACVTIGWLLLSYRVIGRQIYAVGGNEEAARFSGLPVGAIKIRIYALSGLFTGIAGMISTGYFQSANTGTGEGYELMVIAAAVVGGAGLAGGRGTAMGAMLGALVIKLIENGIFMVKKIDLGPFTLTLSKEYSKIVIGLAIMLAVAMDRLSQRWRNAHARRSIPDRPS